MKKKLLSRINDIQNLIIEFEEKITTKVIAWSGSPTKTTIYDTELFQQIKSSCLSLILQIYGEEHPYYTEFMKGVKISSNYKTARGILRSIEIEISNDWLLSIKSLLSAEIFSDFLEMSEYLLKENYKDPAAVMIGSVLEEQLRQLSNANGNPVTDLKGKPKKANLLNAELTKLNVYNKLDEKNVTALLDLRNKAAHGKYSEYTKDQVNLMLKSVRDFILRNPVK